MRKVILWQGSGSPNLVFLILVALDQCSCELPFNFATHRPIKYPKSKFIMELKQTYKGLWVRVRDVSSHKQGTSLCHYVLYVGNIQFI